MKIQIKNFILLFVVLCIFQVSLARAEQIAVFKEGRLVISETTVIKEIPLPKEIFLSGVTAEELRKLVTGEKREIKVMGKEKTIGVFSSSRILPLMVSIEFWPQEVMYVGGVFKSKLLLKESRQKADLFTTIVCLVTPFLIILVLTLLNQWEHVGDKKLFVFYFSNICTVMFGLLAGLLDGGSGGIWFVISMLVSIITNLYFASPVTKLYLAEDMTVSRLLGFILGAIGGPFISGISGHQGHEIVLQYLMFLVGCMIFSYAVGKMVVRGKERFFPKIKNLEENASPTQ